MDLQMPADALSAFETEWREFERTLTRILPRSLAVRDPDISEEIPVLLFCRDCIEDDFMRFPDEPRLAPYRTKLLPLDAELLLRRNDLLRAWSLDEYRAWRARNNVPRSRWWWYLDEAPEGTMEAVRESLARISAGL